MQRRILSLLAACWLWSTVTVTGAAESIATLAGIAHTADVIFIGTVSDVAPCSHADGRSIVTHVQFQSVEELHRRASEPSEGLQTLVHAGGAIDGKIMHVSGQPEFVVGERYLIFALLGGVYANPIVGGDQGLYRLTRDTESERWYPLNRGRGVRGVVDGYLERSSLVVRVAGGEAIYEESHLFPREGSPVSVVGEVAKSRPDGRAPSILTLEEFANAIDRVLAEPAPIDRVFRGVGGAPKSEEQGLPTKAFRSGLERVSTPLRFPDLVSGATGSGSIGASASASMPASAGPGSTPLCWCGFHDLFLVMEQVPDSWWSFQHNNDCMWQFNQFMDIYRYTDDDGYFSNDSTNEFIGWPSESDLQSVYGFGWGTALALTISTTSCDCCEISQADVGFNPAYEWWEELDDTLGYPGRVLYRSVLMHELGHTWGLQRGTCVEDYMYDNTSIMHGYSYWIVEDGLGLHGFDAYAIREIYDAQTPILGIVDMGVESYYADGGINVAYTNGLGYTVGDPITVFGLTVENLTDSARTDVRLRLFLSWNDTISDIDHQIGSDWYWDTFGAESYWSGDLTSTVPDVPPGQYYVGLLVTQNGLAYEDDDLWFNDATFLPTPITVLEPPTSIPFVRGDSNMDGVVEVSDVVGTLEYVSGLGTIPCEDAADGNDDGALDIADPVYVLAFLFTGGAPPPAPFPTFGVDLTSDFLDCQ